MKISYQGILKNLFRKIHLSKRTATGIIIDERVSSRVPSFGSKCFYSYFIWHFEIFAISTYIVYDVSSCIGQSSRPSRIQSWQWFSWEIYRRENSAARYARWKFQKKFPISCEFSRSAKKEIAMVGIQKVARRRVAWMLAYKKIEYAFEIQFLVLKSIESKNYYRRSFVLF